MPHVTFIHGIANKPSEITLLNIWNRALGTDLPNGNRGLNLGTQGVTSSMIYWADVMYEEPAEETAAHESTGQELVTGAKDEDDTWRQSLQGEEKAVVELMAARLDFDNPPPAGNQNFVAPALAESSPAESVTNFELIPLPWFIKRRFMKAFLRDVHHYLFNAEYSPRPGTTYRVQEEIRRRFVKALRQDAAQNSEGPHLVVSHSMGTVISYDCLLRAPDCPKVDALMTLGSPLGLEEVQYKLKPEWTTQNGFPRARVSGVWANIFDRLDPVAGFDPILANEYQEGGKEVVQDVNEQNWGQWRHDITKYLSGAELRKRLRQMLDL